MVFGLQELGDYLNSKYLKFLVVFWNLSWTQLHFLIILAVHKL